MKLSTTLALALALALTAGTGVANAALQSRLGGQAYYDTTKNLTWLADANRAQTSGYDATRSRAASCPIREECRGRT
jgi:hypothetical protein